MTASAVCLEACSLHIQLAHSPHTTQAAAQHSEACSNLQVNGRDTLLLDAAGLLTSRCVMAHAVCLEDAELRVLAERGTAIAHCPLSNFFFADKLLRVRHCRGLGVKVSAFMECLHAGLTCRAPQLQAK